MLHTASALQLDVPSIHSFMSARFNPIASYISTAGLSAFGSSLLALPFSGYTRLPKTVLLVLFFLRYNITLKLMSKIFLYILCHKLRFQSFNTTVGASFLYDKKRISWSIDQSKPVYYEFLCLTSS